MASVNVFLDAVDMQTLTNLERRRYGHEREDGQKPRVSQHLGVLCVETEGAGKVQSAVEFDSVVRVTRFTKCQRIIKEVIYEG